MTKFASIGLFRVEVDGGPFDNVSAIDCRIKTDNEGFLVVKSIEQSWSANNRQRRTRRNLAHLSVCDEIRVCLLV
jgi:hypothetical protein